MSWTSTRLQNVATNALQGAKFVVVTNATEVSPPLSDFDQHRKVRKSWADGFGAPPAQAARGNAR